MMTETTTQPTTTHNPPRCLGVQAAARYLAIGSRTLDNWRAEGRGPSYVRIGTRIVYRVEDLETYLNARAVDVEER